MNKLTGNDVIRSLQSAACRVVVFISSRVQIAISLVRANFFKGKTLNDVSSQSEPLV